MSDFYIGYLPQAPDSLARRIKRVVMALFALAVVLAVTLVPAQQPFDASTFEFGTYRTFEGVVETQPYPALLVERPGGAQPARYLLLAPGKHGAEGLIAGLAGKRVRLEASLIYREHHTMLELRPGAVSILGAAPLAPPAETDLGPLTVTGEIVDTKCYFGVMNPGRGKVHRDCAARCLSGGIPPALLVRSTGALYLLTDAAGAPLAPRRFLRRVGEPFTLSGNLIRRGDTLLLKTSVDQQ